MGRVVVYRGAIKSLIKERVVNKDGSYSFKSRNITIQKDVFFYRDLLGRFVCVDSNIAWDSYQVADYYTTELLRLNLYVERATCNYIDSIHDEVMITRKQFKVFKNKIRDNSF